MIRLRRFGSLILALLRELSDESAYHRHLVKHSHVHSPEEWRKFCDERLRAKFLRTRCC